MTSPLTPSQKAANALQGAENALRNWQDDLDSPRSDVDKMLAIVADLRVWTQGHVEADIERRQNTRRNTPPIVAESGEEYDSALGGEGNAEAGKVENAPDEQDRHKRHDED